MNRLLPTILAGFLLIGEQAGVIGWYENYLDCRTASKYVGRLYVVCVPDRFAIAKARANSLEQKFESDSSQEKP